MFPVRLSFAPLALTLALQAAPAIAAPTDALGQCFVDSTSAAEKQTISRWLFIVLAQQPEVRDLASIPEEARQTTDRAMAKLVERLLTEACRDQAQQTLAQEGPRALKQSVEFFAQSAARRTFAEPNVGKAINGFTRYLDMSRILQSFLTLRLGR